MSNATRNFQFEVPQLADIPVKPKYNPMDYADNIEAGVEALVEFHDAMKEYDDAIAARQINIRKQAVLDAVTQLAAMDETAYADPTEYAEAIRQVKSLLTTRKPGGGGGSRAPKGTSDKYLPETGTVTAAKIGANKHGDIFVKDSARHLNVFTNGQLDKFPESVQIQAHDVKLEAMKRNKQVHVYIPKGERFEVTYATVNGTREVQSIAS